MGICHCTCVIISYAPFNTENDGRLAVTHRWGQNWEPLVAGLPSLPPTRGAERRWKGQVRPKVSGSRDVCGTELQVEAG